MVRVGLVGAGRIGARYLEVLAEEPDVVIAGIGVRNVDPKYQQLAKRFNTNPYSEDRWSDLIDPRNLDLLFVTSSEWAHEAPFLIAAKAGISIVIEKPFGVDWAQAKRMRDAAQVGGIDTQICFTSRFNPRLCAALAAKSRGGFGKLGYLYSRRNADAATASRVSGRLRMPFWIACHDVDLIRFLSQSEVKRVRCRLVERSASGGFLWAELEMENGSVGVIENSWMGESNAALHQGRLDLQYENGRIEVVLDDDSVKAAGAGLGFILEGTLDQYRCVSGRWEGATPAMLRHFIRAKQKREVPITNLLDGIAAVRVCEALARSAETNSLVDLSDV